MTSTTSIATTGSGGSTSRTPTRTGTRPCHIPMRTSPICITVMGIDAASLGLRAPTAPATQPSGPASSCDVRTSRTKRRVCLAKPLLQIHRLDGPPCSSERQQQELTEPKRLSILGKTDFQSQLPELRLRPIGAAQAVPPRERE